MSKNETSEVALILDRFIEGIFRLMQDHHRNHVTEMDLTVVQVQTLASLHKAPSLASRLAASLGISGPAMTQLTDRLIRKQLIERRRIDGDRRAVMIALTEQGSRVVERFRKRRGEVFAETLSRLNASDQTEVVDALNKFVVALEGPEQRKTMPTRHPVQVGRSKSRTAVDPPEASNEAVEKRVVPPVRRMRIEWD